MCLFPLSANIGERFHVVYTDQEIGENLSLQEKLKGEFGIELPPLPDTEDLNLNDYFAGVEQAVRHQQRWAVERNNIALGFFSFGKFLMYRDLDAAAWPPGSQPTSHHILRALLKDSFHEPPAEFTETDQLDDHLKPADVHHVVDADGTQMLAIYDAVHGRNLIIQGPPGTGKSQTITNIIAEAIGAGKTVLFVAEKMAALEVVKRRLDAVGLGDACLELHSHKTQKLAVVQEIWRTLQLGQPRRNQAENDLTMLLTMRTRLNDYSKAVNTPLSSSGVSPYQAYGELIKVQKRLKAVKVPDLALSSISQWTAADFARRLAVVEELQHHLQSTKSSH